MTTFSIAYTKLKAIDELGARRIVVYGVPAIGCVPSQRTLAGGPLRNCADNSNQASQVYNTKLQALLDSLSQKLPLSKIVYVDVYNPLLHIVQNPQEYGTKFIHHSFFCRDKYLFSIFFPSSGAGFDVVDKGCCGTGDIEVSVLCNKLSKTCPDRSRYLFWDSYHPTEKGYQILVDPFITDYISRLL